MCKELCASATGIRHLVSRSSPAGCNGALQINNNPKLYLNCVKGTGLAPPAVGAGEWRFTSNMKSYNSVADPGG